MLRSGGGEEMFSALLEALGEKFQSRTSIAQILTLEYAMRLQKRIILQLAIPPEKLPSF